MTLTGLLFMLSFLGACFLSLARHPIWGLVAYIAVFYLHPPARWWGASLPDLRWSLSAALVMLLSLLVHRQVLSRKPSVFKHGYSVGFALFVVWLAIEFGWAWSYDAQMELLVLYLKFLLLIFVMYHVIEHVEHLRIVLWTHVLGCLYFGWIAYTTYQGGRFESFGGPGMEANTGAMQLVTGVFTMGALFLAGNKWEKLAVIGCAPLILNALITTVSRSGFLCIVAGGILFVHYSPREFKGRVLVLSTLALILFVMLTNPFYWTRMSSVKQVGQDVEGVETGQSRLAMMDAQLRMFRDHPLGVGHEGSEYLSPIYLSSVYLAGGEGGGRASHNTFLSMLVEHGMVGGLLYLLMVLWSIRALRRLARSVPPDGGLVACLVPALFAIIAAQTLGDMFVPYVKSEGRVWFFVVLMVLLQWTTTTTSSKSSKRSRRPIGASQQRHNEAAPTGSVARPLQCTQEPRL